MYEPVPFYTAINLGRVLVVLRDVVIGVINQLAGIPARQVQERFARARDAEPDYPELYINDFV